MPRLPPEAIAVSDAKVPRAMTIDLEDTTIDSRLRLVATMAIATYLERFLPDSKMVLADSKLT